MPAPSAMTDDMLLPLALPAIKLMKVIAAFDGGRLSSNGGVAVLALAEKRAGIIERLSSLFPDDRDQEQVIHPMGSRLCARILAIGCGYEDGNVLNQYQQAGGEAVLIGGSIMVDQTVLSSKGSAKEALITARTGTTPDTTASHQGFRLVFDG